MSSPVEHLTLHYQVRIYSDFFNLLWLLILTYIDSIIVYVAFKSRFVISIHLKRVNFTSYNNWKMNKVRISLGICLYFSILNCLSLFIVLILLAEVSTVKNILVPCNWGCLVQFDSQNEPCFWNSVALFRLLAENGCIRLLKQETRSNLRNEIVNTFFAIRNIPWFLVRFSAEVLEVLHVKSCQKHFIEFTLFCF